MLFHEIDPKNIKDNPIKMIADEWMLVSVGNEAHHNMMTASWGFVGEMWGKDCAITAVRPTRYTYEFMKECDTFALCFMGDNSDVHKICGSKSGRDIDKVSATGLTPVYDCGTMYFEEARLVLICKKMYADDLRESGFCDKEALNKWYHNDLHTMFYGEIIKVLAKN